jgi:hypothetical protein
MCNLYTLNVTEEGGATRKAAPVITNCFLLPHHLPELTYIVLIQNRVIRDE